MKYKWLLFDADGTLFDFDRAAAAALQETFTQLTDRFEPGYIGIYNRINAQLWLDFEAGLITQELLKTKRFEMLFEALDLKADAAAFSRRYPVNLSGHSDLYAGTEEIIRQLAARSRLMMITNGLKDVQRPRFARATISKYFDDFVISEEVGSAKPHAEIFDDAFGRMNNPARSEVLIIGDSLTSDIKGGNNYGIDTCWFNPGGRTCDKDVDICYEIRRLDELLDIVSDEL